MQQRTTSNDVKRSKEAAIFEAACTVIRDKGFHQARIIDIAREAGISYGLVYHYFSSKADLFDAISKEWWTGLYDTVERCDREYPSIEEKLGAIVNYFMDLYERRPSLVHIFVTEISRSTSNLTPDRLAFFKVFFERIDAIMARAQSEGALRSDLKARYLTYIFFGGLESFISTMVLENQPFRDRDQKERISSGLLEVFFNGARPRAS